MLFNLYPPANAGCAPKHIQPVSQTEHNYSPEISCACTRLQTLCVCQVLIDLNCDNFDVTASLRLPGRRSPMQNPCKLGKANYLSQLNVKHRALPSWLSLPSSPGTKSPCEFNTLLRTTTYSYTALCAPKNRMPTTVTAASYPSCCYKRPDPRARKAQVEDSGDDFKPK